MTDIVERLRGRADRYRQLWGNAAYYTEGDALFDEKTADTITTLRATNERLRAALREIDHARYTGRNTISPDNAFEHAIALNEKLIAVMDIARAALKEAPCSSS